MQRSSPLPPRRVELRRSAIARTAMPPAKPRRKRGKSPTARALDDLRKLGFKAGVVEKRLPHCFITKDLFGCIDIIAMRPGVGILAVQATGGDGGNHAARRTKSAAEPDLRTWLESGARFEIWSYRLAGAKGDRKLYTLRREELKVADLTSPIEPATAELFAEMGVKAASPAAPSPLFAGGPTR